MLVIFRTYLGRRLGRRLDVVRAGARDDGFLLIEVVMSALLVAFIVVAMFNGLESAGQATADERYHDEAALLASESQEALRSDPASALDTIQGSKSHVYTETIDGATYTITEKTEFVNGTSGKVGCSATGTEQSKQGGDYIQISSSVTWPALEANKLKRPPVKQTSLITPPDGSSLEVDVTNGESTPQPVEGATVIAGEAQGTTSSAGCIVFGSIPSTTVNVEAYKANYVTPSGAYKVIDKELSIAPNLTTHYPVTLASGGSIVAEFMNKGKAVTGDTFVVYNSNMGVSPNFELGSTKVTTYADGEYEALTGTYEATAQTPINATDYATGNLFPFTTKWAVYAGDCTENDAGSVTKQAVKDGEALVVGGGAVKATVPTSLVTLNVYTGSSPSKQESLETKEMPVKITNETCKTTVPNNASKVTYVHEQKTKEGHLAYPYQPFGRFSLCVYNSKNKETYTTGYETKAEAGPTATIYLSAKASKSGTTENSVTAKTEQGSC